MFPWIKDTILRAKVKVGSRTVAKINFVITGGVAISASTAWVLYHLDKSVLSKDLTITAACIRPSTVKDASKAGIPRPKALQGVAILASPSIPVYTDRAGLTLMLDLVKRIIQGDNIVDCLL